MNCPKCGSETSKVKISFFVRGNACSCGWCDFADKIKARSSLFSRFSSAFHSYKTYSYKWKFLRFRFGIPHFISKHFTRLPLYTEEEPIEISHSARPKEEKTKEQPLYKIRKRGWKEKRKSFKLGGSPPMNKRIKVQYLPIPMPKFMASAILTLFMIILAGGYQYVHIMYPFIPSIPFLFFLNKPKEKCALKGCDNSVSEDSPISVVKGRTLRFCSQEHADIYSNTSQFGEYERIQKMYGRRDLLKGIALAGLGAGVAGLLSGMKISEAAVDTTKPAVVSQFSQIGDASFVVFQDKNGNSYVVDKGGGTQPGMLVVNANVITSYGASLGAGTAGAQTTTLGIQEAMNSLTPNRTWKQTVTITGNMVVNSVVNVPSFTQLVINGKIMSGSGVNQPIFRNSNTTNGNTDIEIIGGILDGNASAQTAQNYGLIEFWYVLDGLIMNTKVQNAPWWGILVRGDKNSVNNSARILLRNCKVKDTAGYSYALYGDFINAIGCEYLQTQNYAHDCFNIGGSYHNYIGNQIIVQGGGVDGFSCAGLTQSTIMGNVMKGVINGMWFYDLVSQNSFNKVIGNEIYGSGTSSNFGIRTEGGSAVLLIMDNRIRQIYSSGYGYGIYVNSNYNWIINNDVTDNLRPIFFDTGATSGNYAVNNRGYNPQGFAITTPAMPTSGTAQSNTFPFPVIVYLYGGTVTQITINGQVVFSSGTGISLTGQSFTLNPRDTIAITYSVAPTWKWYGL